MTVQIGEVSSEVEVTGAGRSTDQATSSAGARQPGWVERDQHQRLVEAATRDAARTCPEVRYG